MLEALRRDVILDLIAAGRELGHYSCTPATDGNFSAKIDSDAAVITRSGTAKSVLIESDFVMVRLSEPAADGASTEWRLHQQLYSRRPDVRCILHAHAPHLTAFAVAQRVPEVRLLAESIASVGEIALVPFALPGTTAVGELALEQSTTASVYLLANHGAVAVGRTVSEALHRLLRAEFLARVELQAAALGGGIPLRDSDVIALRKA